MLCPHCQAEIGDEVRFCTACGMAASVEHKEPRIVNETKGIATSVAGQSLQAENLRKAMKKAFTGLLITTCLQGLGFAFFTILFLSNTVAAERQALLITAVVVGVVFFGFVGLTIWSRSQPFAAAVTGLSMLVTLWVVDVIANPATICSGFIVKIIILALLIQSVQAGLAHRRLARAISLSRAAHT